MCLPGLDLPGRGLHELGLSGCDPFGRGLTVHVRPNGYGILKFNIQQFRLFMTETLIILFIIFYGRILRPNRLDFLRSSYFELDFGKFLDISNKRFCWPIIPQDFGRVHKKTNREIFTPSCGCEGPCGP